MLIINLYMQVRLFTCTISVAKLPEYPESRSKDLLTCLRFPGLICCCSKLCDHFCVLNKALLEDTLNCWKFLATLTSLNELLLDLQYNPAETFTDEDCCCDVWGWLGGLELEAVLEPGLELCLEPVELQFSSDRRQQLYNLGLWLGDMVKAEGSSAMGRKVYFGSWSGSMIWPLNQNTRWLLSNILIQLAPFQLSTVKTPSCSLVNFFEF